MAMANMSGQQAASRKYDILTALGTSGLSGSPVQQRRALRLISLLTARYDWRLDRLSTGQREIAALWSVDERTVKREMAHFRDCGWLILKRQGVRGQVSTYGLGLQRILDDTRSRWSAVGPDFVERLQEDASPVRPRNVIPFPTPNADGVWGKLCAVIAAENPTLYSTWLHPLQYVDLTDGELRLKAPSRFHANYVQIHHLARLLSLSRHVLPDIRILRIEAE